MVEIIRIKRREASPPKAKSMGRLFSGGKWPRNRPAREAISPTNGLNSSPIALKNSLSASVNLVSSPLAFSFPLAKSIVYFTMIIAKIPETQKSWFIERPFISIHRELYFCYNELMRVEINSHGNGACPLCNSSGNCRVQDTLSGSVEAFSQSDKAMELSVLSCPLFQEKAERE